MQQEMQKLAKDIMGSFEARVAGITALRQEVDSRRSAARSQIRGLEQARATTARQQRARLVESHAALRQNEGRRSSQVKAWMGGVAANHAKGRAAWRDMGTTMRGRRAAAPPSPPSAGPAEAGEGSEPASRATPKKAGKRHSAG